jgi:endonuclease/exonuclease/phosphatase family metal-dependent hydrolase
MKIHRSVAISAEHVPEPSRKANTGQKLRILSFNIQTGISTERFHHYVTKAWKHVLPHPTRFRNLDRIADLVRDYDLVGLQEVDAGSLRSGFVNLTEYVAHRAEFPFWYDQTNRKFGGVARHAIGMLSRFQCTEIIEHRLPGPIPGRGALSMRFGQGEDALLVMILHLALGKRARLQQLDYIADQVNNARHVILMGDMNFHSESAEMEFLINRTLMTEPIHGLHTWPSWRPRRSIDHILVTPSVQVDHVRVLDFPVSDHLPISMEITLPKAVVMG